MCLEAIDATSLIHHAALRVGSTGLLQGLALLQIQWLTVKASHDVMQLLQDPNKQWIYNR